jgi:hypothetical protein
MDDKVYDEPTRVDAEDGKVILDGPDGVAVRMTPDAALETSDRLLSGATQAMGQQVQEERRTERREPLAEEPPPGRQPRRAAAAGCE